MPTYEFRCPEGHEFEKFYRSIAGAPREIPCPECGKIAERQMSAGAGLVFKGSGFYITDYGKDGKKSSASSDTGSSSSKSESAPKSDKSSPDAKPVTESKPAASTPAEKPSSGKKTNE
jgi:putative FmdB family regulatory protein